jgi:hypothetical protein
MNCDVCNATITQATARSIPADRFRQLLDRGFGINETNMKMLTESGVSREDAITMLNDAYRTSQSEWLLCQACFVKAQSNMTS